MFIQILCPFLKIGLFVSLHGLPFEEQIFLILMKFSLPVIFLLVWASVFSQEISLYPDSVKVFNYCFF
jgi:hypothetical protein